MASQNDTLEKNFDRQAKKAAANLSNDGLLSVDETQLDVLKNRNEVLSAPVKSVSTPSVGGRAVNVLKNILDKRTDNQKRIDSITNAKIEQSEEIAKSQGFATDVLGRTLSNTNPIVGVKETVQDIPSDIREIGTGIEKVFDERSESLKSVINNPEATTAQKVVRAPLEAGLALVDSFGEVVLGGLRTVASPNLERQTEEAITNAITNVANTEQGQKAINQTLNWYEGLSERQKINVGTIGIAGSILSEFVGPGAGKGVKKLAKESAESAVNRILREEMHIETSIADEVAKKIAETTNEREVKNILQNAQLRTLQYNEAVKKGEITGEVTPKVELQKQAILDNPDIDVEQLLDSPDIDSTVRIAGKTPTQIVKEANEEASELVRKEIELNNAVSAKRIDDIVNSTKKKVKSISKVALRKKLKLEAKGSLLRKQLDKELAKETPDNIKVVQLREDISQNDTQLSQVIPKAERRILARQSSTQRRVSGIKSKTQIMNDRAELKQIKRRLIYETKAAIEEGSVEKLNKAVKANEAINTNLRKLASELKEEPLVRDFSTGTSRKEIKIAESVNANEFAIIQADKIGNKLVDEGTALRRELKKLTPEQMQELYDQRESGLIDPKYRELNNMMTSIVKQINDQLYELGLLESKPDPRRYIKTYLSTLDGKPITDAQKLEIEARGLDDTFTQRDLLNTNKDAINKTNLKRRRKYKDAIERDRAFEKAGAKYKTNKDLESVFSAYVDNSVYAIKQGTVAKSFRDLARDGARGESLIEVFNPEELRGVKETIRNSLRQIREQISETIANTKGLSSEVRKQAKEAIDKIENSQFLDLEDAFGNSIADQRRAVNAKTSAYFDSIIDSIDTDKNEYSEVLKEIYQDAKDKASQIIQDEYKDITLRASKALQDGYIDLSKGVRGYDGLFGKRKESAFVQEFNRKLSKTGLTASLEDAANFIKRGKATGDLFAVPRAWIARMTLSNPIEGTYKFIKEDLLNNKGEYKYGNGYGYIETGARTVGDFETINTIRDTLTDEVSNFTKFIDKIDAKTDVAGLKQLKAKYINLTQKLERVQFEGIMTNAKIGLWNDNVDYLVKKGVPLEDSKVQAGKWVDIATGVSNFEKVMARHPNTLTRSVQRGLKTMLFSPNLLLTTMRQMKGYGKVLGRNATKAEKIMARKTAFMQLVTGMTLLQATSLALNGKTTFQNDDPSRWYMLQAGDDKDEQGNQRYINILGYLNKPASLITQPTRDLINKRSPILSGLYEFFGNNPYDDSSDFSFAKRTADSLLPIPITAQNIVSAYRGANNEEEDYGVHENFWDSMGVSALEFMGFESTYTSGNSKRQTLDDIPRQLAGAIDDPKNFRKHFSLLTLFNYLRSAEIPEYKDVLRKEYGMEGSITKSENMVKFLTEMPEHEKELLKEQYSSEGTQKTIKQWELAFKYPDLSRNQLQELYRKEGLIGEDDKISASTYAAYGRKAEHKLLQDKAEEFKEDLTDLVTSGQITEEESLEIWEDFKAINITREEKEKNLFKDYLADKVIDGSLTEEDALSLWEESNGSTTKMKNIIKQLEE